MGNEVSAANLDMLSSLIQSTKPISFAGAQRLWRHVNYYALSECTNSQICFRLLGSHNGPLNLCQLSWMVGLVGCPYDENGVHVLHTFPNVKPLFEIKGLTKSDLKYKSVNEDYVDDYFTEDNTIYDVYPDLKVQREPTLEEKLTFSMYDDTSNFDTFFEQFRSDETELLLSTQLLMIRHVNLNKANLQAMVNTMKQINLPPKMNNYKIDLFKFIINNLYKLYCSENDIEDELWADIFKYLLYEPYIYETYINAREFTPLVMCGGSLKYLLGYPLGSQPSRDQMLKDMLVMFKDVNEHQVKIRNYNMDQLNRYVASFPYPVTLNHDSSLLDYPPVELVFTENEGKIEIITRKHKSDDKETSCRLGLVEFLYDKLIETDKVGTVTECLFVFREPSFYLEFTERCAKQNESS